MGRIEEKIKELGGIDLSAKYGDFYLKNPVLVAPGQLTRTENQIEEIKRAGFAGCVLKSVVGEDRNGNCSMKLYRTPPTYIKSVYDPDDTDKKFPIIHWDGRGDTRGLSEYIDFAERAFKYEEKNNFLVVASLLCHLPLPCEEIKKEEWIYTAERLYEKGAKIFEIDFCPQLKKEEERIEKENILRWYEEVPVIIKSVSNNISVFPKILNLEALEFQKFRCGLGGVRGKQSGFHRGVTGSGSDRQRGESPYESNPDRDYLDFGIEFQIEMVKAAVKGKADGVVIGNRIFKKEFGSAHGGKELKERNIRLIREVKKLFPALHISGTGGIYTGRDILDYMKAGAENVQILSFLMGKSSINFGIEGTKFEKVLHFLLFDRETGLIPLLMKNSTVLKGKK